MIVIICLLALTIGLSLLTAILFIRFDDARNIVAVVLQILFYLTPIIYPKDILDGPVQVIVSINPFTSYLDIFRVVFASTGEATLFDWLYMFTSSILILVIGLFVFKRSWAKSVVMM